MKSFEDKQSFFPCFMMQFFENVCDVLSDGNTILSPDAANLPNLSHCKIFAFMFVLINQSNP